MPQLKMSFTNKNNNVSSLSMIQAMSKYNTPTLQLLGSQRKPRIIQGTNTFMQPMINNVLNAKKGGCKSCGR